MNTTNEDIAKRIAPVLKKYNVTRATLFGSRANHTNHDKSDVDLLVEFKTKVVSLFCLSGLRLELEECLGINVDLVHAPVPDDSILEIDKEVLLYEA